MYVGIILSKKHDGKTQNQATSTNSNEQYFWNEHIITKYIIVI